MSNDFVIARSEILRTFFPRRWGGRRSGSPLEEGKKNIYVVLCEIYEVPVWFTGFSYRELQSFVEQAVTLAVEECTGAACLGYSYPGQAGFLQRTGHHRSSLLAGAYTTQHVRMIGQHPDTSL